MTTGRINQITTFAAETSSVQRKSLLQIAKLCWLYANLLFP